jgi:serine protease AprX
MIRRWFNSAPLRVALVACAALLAFANPASAQRGKLDKALRSRVDLGRADRSGSDGGRVRVIITTTSGQRQAVRGKLTRKSRAINAEHRHAFTATVDVKDLAELANDPAVVSVSIDAPVFANQTSAGTGPDSLLKLNLLRSAIRSTSSIGVTGAGVGVAIIDSGISNSSNLSSRIRAFYDFTDGGRQVAPYDDFGHGTHIAATIGSTGQQQQNKTWRGVAPGVSLIGLKVLDKNGAGTTSWVISALEFATANKAALGIDVINLSLGHPIYESAATDPLVQAVEGAVRAGIVVVTSAGNYGMNPDTGVVGYAGITSPGNSPSAITVGATNVSGTSGRSNDFIAPYSSRGPTMVDGFAKPDLVAPGHRLVADTSYSTLYKNNPAWKVNGPWGSTGNYMRLSGSSMSAAVVSGVVALVLEANRTTIEPDQTNQEPLNPYAVKTILEYTATQVAGANALEQGAGQVNASGAVEFTRALDTRTTPWLVGPLDQETSFGGVDEPWSGRLIYGADELSNLTPDIAVSGANIVWSTNIVWGTNIVWSTANNIVWSTGSNIVWSTNGIEPHNIVWSTANNIVWSTANNIVWSTANNIVWSTANNIVWSTANNIVWSTANNIVWSTSAELPDDDTPAPDVDPTDILE